MSISTRTSVIYTRRVRFDTYECDYDTHESDVFLCDVYTHTVMNTRTSVISERKVWFQHARVWFIYVGCDFHTLSVISTRRVWLPHAECDFYTQSVISIRSVILTRTNVITTLTTVISTRTRVIFKRRV
jgi:hypothetical protein